MEVIIAMLIGVAVSLLCIIWALGVIFYRTKENNKLLLDIQNKLSEKEPEFKVDYPDSDDLFNIVKNQANSVYILYNDGSCEKLKYSEDLKPSEDLKRKINMAKNFEVGTKVIAMKGIHIGEVYTIEKIDLCWYEAVLQPYMLPEGLDYMETLRINLDDLENEFEVLEDEE